MNENEHSLTKHSNTDASHRQYWEKEIRCKRVHTVWFHFFQSKRIPKLISANRIKLVVTLRVHIETRRGNAKGLVRGVDIFCLLMLLGRVFSSWKFIEFYIYDKWSIICILFSKKVLKTLISMSLIWIEITFHFISVKITCTYFRTWWLQRKVENSININSIIRPHKIALSFCLVFSVWYSQVE